MEVKIQGQSQDIAQGTKLKLHTGQVAEARNMLRDGLLVKLDTGGYSIIDPFKDILEVIIEQVKQSLTQLIVTAISSFFSRLIKKL
jgi:predicted metal-dependent phosphotriesterase family hydrolase